MRTFWMRLFTLGNVGLLAVFVYFFFVFVLPNASKPEAAPFVPVFAIFMVLFVVIILASVAWPGASRRRLFWLVAAIPALLVLLLFGPQITYDIARPIVASSFISTLIGISASLITLASAVIAFLQVGRAARGRSTDTSPRTRLVLTGILGAIVGASLTAIAAASSASGGGTVAEAPTTSTTLQARDTKYVETALSVKNGEVLGIFVTNRDAFGHSFDIDALNVHVVLPANSTTAVAIRPTAAGKLEYYCSVPGHRQGGMVGTITVQ